MGVGLGRPAGNISGMGYATNH